MHLRNLFLALAFLAVSAVSGWAGGSIEWSEVQAQITREDPFLSRYIAATFEVNRVGGGVRVGHDAQGNSLLPGVGVGTRIPPFEFLAKPLGAPGDFTLYLTFDVESFDNGKTSMWSVKVRQRRPGD